MYYRYTYNGIGIYEAFRNASLESFKRFKRSEDSKWLPIPDVYEKSNSANSYFTELGRSVFREKVVPWIKNSISWDDVKLVCVEVDPSQIVYRDQYQIVIKT